MANEVYEYKLLDLTSQIPRYSEEQNSLNTFVEACDTVLGLASPQIVPLIILNIKTKLDGRASQIIDARNLRDWRSIKELLINHFGDCRDTTGLLYDLHTFRQNKNEPASSFVHRISAHLTKIRSSITLDDRLDEHEKETQIALCNKIGLKTLLSGLNSTLGPTIRAQQPEDIAEASHFIIEEERALYLEAKLNSIPEKQYQNTRLINNANTSNRNTPVYTMRFWE